MINFNLLKKFFLVSLNNLTKTNSLDSKGKGEGRFIFFYQFSVSEMVLRMTNENYLSLDILGYGTFDTFMF